jgi:hypothetical protein
MYDIYDGNTYAGLSYYGGFRTRTFAQIFPSFDVFETVYNASGLAISFSTEADVGITLKQLYIMLYAHYGNSHISYSDENQFIYYMFSIIYQYGPTVIREREIQDKLRGLTDAELTLGGKAIYNHAYNPSTAPSTTTLEELPTINDQNTTNYKKSTMEGYATLLALLKKDVIDEFIHRFKQLFIQVAAPDYPLLYTTEVSN